MNGLGTTAPPSDITQYYKGGGRNGLESITAINQAGAQVMQQAKQQTCVAGDANCKALQTGGNKYTNQLNGTDPRSKYKATAESLRAAQNQRDPLAVLGIGIPSANGGNVCIESTVDLPTRYEQKQCVQATMKTLHNLAKLPVSTGYSYTQPYCIDPSMTLSANQSLCSKTVYSCPNGGTLNGTQCVISADATLAPRSLGLPDFSTGFCTNEMALMKVVPDWKDPRKLQVILWDNYGRCGYNEFSDAELIAYGFPTELVYAYHSNPSYNWWSDSYSCPEGTVIYTDYWNEWSGYTISYKD